MFKSILPVLILLLINHSSFAQSNISFFQGKSDTISFELTEYNNIAVKAVLNEKDTMTLMLHTAINEVSLTKIATQRIRSFKFSHIDSVKTWGGVNESRFSEKNILSIGNLTWNDIRIWESEHSGHNTDRKFGLNLFEDKIVELNFEKNYLVIHSSLPSMKKDYKILNVIQESGLMFIEGDCKIENDVYTKRFLIHSGYSGSVLFDDEFVARNGISLRVDAISESVLKDSYGNELKTINVILPFFQIGQEEFSDVPIGFFEGSINRQKMSVLGGELLKRFNIIFDQKNRHIYLRPNQLFNLPFSKT